MSRPKDKPEQVEQKQSLSYEENARLSAISSLSYANTREALAIMDISKDSEFWSPAFEDVKNAIKREVLLREKLTKLKRLLLLVDPAVDNEPMNELTKRQWAEFVKAFPDEDL